MTNRIDHSNCDHAATSSARAKCRRSGGNAENGQGATTRTINFKGSGAAKARTPRDRDKQCDNCGVERIAYKGTDPTNGILRYVGDKCEYIVRHAHDRVELD